MYANLSYRYSVYGLTVLSNFPLALSQDVACGRDKAVVEFELVTSDEFPSLSIANNQDEWFRHSILDDGSIYMRWVDLFDFVIGANGRRLRCRKLSEVPIDSFEAYLTTFGISGALIQQGEEPLHATVVAMNGGAVALLGPSGAGKSTLAAFLMGRGGGLVTDDMLRVEFQSDAAMVSPGPGRLKLFKESAERTLKETANCGLFNSLSEKFIFQTSAVTKPDIPHPLSALYYLDKPPERIKSNSISIERLSGIDLFRTIAASTFNSRLNAADRLKRQFHFAERIAKTIPVYRLTYPRDYDLLSQVADLINKDFQ